MLTSAFLLLGFACSKGSIVLDGDDTGLSDGGSLSDGGGESGTDGGGDAGGDGGTGGGTDGGGDGGTSGGTDGGTSGGTDGGGDGGGTAVDWSGIYTGPIDIDVDSEYGAYEISDCTGSMVIDVDRSIGGGATCSIYGSGLTLPFEGTISEDGEISGTSTLDLGWGSSVELVMSGTVDGSGALPLTLEGELVSSWTSALVYGEGELVRE